MHKFLLFIIGFLLFATRVSASGEFYTKYNVDYKFDSLGKSTITQNISLTNKTTNYYAPRYELEITGENPQNISGRDSTGPLKIDVTPKDATTTILTLYFNDIVVGRDKTLSFSLQYQGKPALHNGQVWELSLPKISQTNIDEYNLNLIVPESFGKPAYLSPPPVSSTSNTYRFTQDQLSQLGVVAAFGNFQSYSFRLAYRITGPGRIALPPDTGYQRVYFDSLVPPPDSVTIDPDGNWLASYQLKPGQTADIIVSGVAHLLAEPLTSFISPMANLDEYLKPTTYWQVDAPQIQELAKKLTTPQAIYDYVVAILSYDYSRVSTNPPPSRLGALAALAKPASAICTEFTDLFIAIARAAGIPTREINGFAYTNDPALRPVGLAADVLHAWPQYWDTNRRIWVNIDPTWAKTTGGVDFFNKLDFNHFTFVIHGLSDSLPPYPTQAKVSYTPYKEYPAQPLITKWRSPPFLIPFLPAKFSYHITNPNGQAVYYPPLALPPFGQTILTTTFVSRQLLGLKPQSVTIMAGATPVIYNIPARLYLPWQIFLAACASFLIITVVITAAKARSLYLQKCRG